MDVRTLYLLFDTENISEFSDMFVFGFWFLVFFVCVFCVFFFLNGGEQCLVRTMIVLKVYFKTVNESQLT